MKTQRTKKSRTKNTSSSRKTTRSKPNTRSRTRAKAARKSTSQGDMSSPAFHLEVKRGEEKTARSADTGFHLYVGKNPETSHKGESKGSNKSKETETAKNQKERVSKS